MQDIERDTTQHWSTLFPVYKMPADTDLKNYQPIQPGRYLVKDSALVFTPDTPFMRGQAYFIRYYQYNKDDNTLNLIRGKQRPGKLRFIDLIFKP